MKLKKILIGLEGLKAKGSLDVDVKHLDSDSKNIKEGDMFVAIKGFSVDGHKYINDAIKAGAKAVMVEQKLDAVMDVRGVFVGGVDISDSVIAKLKGAKK